ncbi:MAG: DUF58 domain-containing protein [Bdellovibrionales bacterium]
MELTRENSGLRNLLKKLQYLFNEQFKAQKTYIVPTRLGLAYGGLCLVLLLMAMAYGNNLVFIVCFTLTVMGMTLARAVNTNIERLEIFELTAHEVFAENQQALQISVENKSSVELKELRAYFKGQEKNLINFTLGPKEILTVDVPYDFIKRGYNSLPRLIIESSYPSDLFRAWKVFKKSDKVLVYPARIGQKDFPQNSTQLENSLGIIREIRDYKPGDSPKRIHWRSLAKNKQLRTLVYEGEEGKKCLFDWSEVTHLPTEQALSQMALWVSVAEKQNYNWTLELPKKTISSELDPRQYLVAMQALALWGDE